MSTTLKSMRWGMVAMIAASFVFIWLSFGPSIGRANHEGDGTIHACSNTTTGEVRFVSAPHHCRSTETSHDLQQAGGSSGVLVLNDETQPVPITGEVSLTDNDEQSSVASKFHLETFHTALDPDDMLVDLPDTINASFIAVTAQDDEVVLEFRYNGQHRLEIGGTYNNIPNVVTMSLPEAVPINQIRFLCANTVEDCQVDVSIVGS